MTRNKHKIHQVLILMLLLMIWPGRGKVAYSSEFFGMDSLYLKGVSLHVTGGCIMKERFKSVEIRSVGLETEIVLEERDMNVKDMKFKILVTNINGADARVEGIFKNEILKRGRKSIYMEIWIGKTVQRRLKIVQGSPEVAGMKFVIMGENRGRYENFDQIISEINKRRPHFVVQMGDFVSGGGKNDFVTFNRYMEVLDVPLYLLMGPVEWASRLGRDYRGEFCTANYTFTYGTYCLIFLDSARRFIRYEDIKWLRGVLESHADKMFLIFTHFPIVDEGGRCIPFLAEQYCLILRDLFKDYKILQVFSSHTPGFYSVSSGGVGYTVFSSRSKGYYNEIGQEQYLIVNIKDEAVMPKPIKIFLQERGTFERLWLIARGYAIQYKWPAIGGTALILFFVIIVFYLRRKKGRRRGRIKL